MSPSDRVLVAAGAAALVLAVAAATVLLLPAEAPPTSAGHLLAPTAGTMADHTAPPSPTSSAIVVDVAGAVSKPGLLTLSAGARVGDAVAAAGGYATDADLEAVAATLNLAQRLADGEQIRVPRVGDSLAGGAASAPDGGTGPAGAADPAGPATSGSVNLNTATPEQLEALPGIGPVTVQKIVAARQERPFTSLEDALQRGVIHSGQLEDIREHATAG